MNETNNLPIKGPSLVIDARMIQHSGIGTYLRMLLPFILPRFNVTLLGDPELLTQYRGSANILTFLAPIYSITEQRLYSKLVPECDLFWSPHYNVPLFKVKARNKITTIHDVFHLAFIDQLGFKKKIYAKLLINRALKSSNEVITVSNFSNNEILRLTKSTASINVIYNGVKQEVTVNNPVQTIATYNLPENYILYVGNVKPHKNLKALAHAYLKLPKGFKDRYKIVVVGKVDGFITGDDELLNLINNNADLKNGIVFTGYINDDDMDAIYSCASAFVFPSIYEGFGLPPLEAMLNKCPVLVSNQSSLPEVCGDAAVYFDPHDVNDIALKIEDILLNDSKRQDLIARGTARVKNFTWEECADKHINLFNKIINS